MTYITIIRQYIPPFYWLFRDLFMIFLIINRNKSPHAKRTDKSVLFSSYFFNFNAYSAALSPPILPEFRANPVANPSYGGYAVTLP